MIDIDQHIPRIRALLRIDSYADSVEPMDPDPEADYIGAAGAVAWQWTSPPARAVVYLAGAGGPDAAEAKLHADLDHPSVVTRSTVNGGLLLWTMALADDEAAVMLLRDLVSDFAGEE